MLHKTKRYKDGAGAPRFHRDTAGAVSRELHRISHDSDRRPYGTEKPRRRWSRDLSHAMGVVEMTKNTRLYGSTHPQISALVPSLPRPHYIPGRILQNDIRTAQERRDSTMTPQEYGNT